MRFIGKRKKKDKKSELIVKDLKYSLMSKAWRFTKENLESSDSWIRKYRKELTLVSQYGGGVLYVEIHNEDGKVLRAELGDYIIKNYNNDNFYPFKEDVFFKLYEIV